MFGLRQKLALGLGGLFLILAIFGIQSFRQIRDVGQSIKVIAENYKSIAACQEIKDAVKEINSGVLLIYAGYADEGMARIESNIDRIYHALDIELKYINIPGERVKTYRIRDLLRAYRPALNEAIDASLLPKEREEIYHKKFLPVSNDIIGRADDILRTNRDTMFKAEIEASERAQKAQRKIYAMAAIIAGFFIFFVFREFLPKHKKIP